MQSNASRPVMDVARRPSSPTTARTPVRPVPARYQQDKPQPTGEQQKPAVKDSPRNLQSGNLEQSKPKNSVPVGIIVMSLLVMMVLIGLAITIYLTSQV